MCHCWLLDRIQVSVRILPVRLALCDLEAPGWGEPWFPHCAFVASRPTDYCMAFLWFCCFALVFFCHTNPWGDTMISSLLVRFRCVWTDQLITDRAGFWCAFVCFVWFWVFVVCFSVLHGDTQWIMYRSNSVLFCMHIVVMTDVATALIRWICKMQLSFRLDKRPGESHLALDGKKSSFGYGLIFKPGWA